MGVFRVAVCEDDGVLREFEKNLVEKWAASCAVQAVADGFSSAENFLFESEDKIDYDLLVLDIQMGKMNGVELARVLRNRGFLGSLVFLTGIRDFAIDGYEVGAVRYLLKPVREADFFEVLSLVHKDFLRRQEEVFLLQGGSEVAKIPYERIIYAESRGHYVFLRFLSERNELLEREWKGNFSAICDDFEAHGFFCLRRGLLVSLSHITKICRTECYLDTGESLPVARGKYQELNQAFIAYYKGMDYRRDER